MEWCTEQTIISVASLWWQTMPFFTTQFIPTKAFTKFTNRAYPNLGFTLSTKQPESYQRIRKITNDPDN